MNVKKKITKKSLKALMNSEVFGAGDYLKGLEKDQILRVAIPLIKAIESGKGIPIKNDSLQFRNPGPEMIEEINNLSPKGLHYINEWIYYHDKKDRPELLNTK